MRIQSNDNISFSGKTRYVNPNVREGIQTLLTRMNSEVTTESNQYCINSKFIHSLSYKDKAEFFDFRGIYKKVLPEEQVTKQSAITINKTQLVIDNKTGRVIDYSKGIFTSWNKIMKNVQKYIDLFLQNYDDNKIVTKNFLYDRTLTEKGREAQKAMYTVL